MAEITKIEKLNGSNYQSWKYNVKLLLMERGLWGFSQPDQERAPAEDAPANVRNAFRLRSDKAYSLIALNVEKDLQIHISSITDPLVAWQTLQGQFEFVSVTQIVRLSRKFYTASMEEGENLMKHLTTMTSLAEQLRELGEEISSRKFATVILGSLPESYDNFLTSLNARAADGLDWENVKGLLIEEDMKRKEKKEKMQEPDNALFMKKGRGGSKHHGEARRGFQSGHVAAEEVVARTIVGEIVMMAGTKDTRIPNAGIVIALVISQETVPTRAAIEETSVPIWRTIPSAMPKGKELRSFQALATSKIFGSSIRAQQRT